MLSEIIDEAREHLSDEAFNAALGTASIAAMNAWRTVRVLSNDTQVRMGLRMNIIANPGVEKADFELWSMAVSTVNGCENCTAAHDDVIRKEGITKEQAWEAVKIAATISGVAQAVEIDANV